MTIIFARRSRRRIAAAAAALAMFTASQSLAQVIDLAGQTVTLVHNAAPGGATAIGAQIAANAWAKTMAGKPTIIVQSVEGGALSRGIHQVLNARPNGLTIGWLAWNGSTRILDPDELQIPFKNFALIGGAGGANFYLHVSKEAGGGLTDNDSFASRVKSLTFGGFNPKSSGAMSLAAALDMLGIDFNFVSGFNGEGPLLAALQRGEIQGYPGTGIFYKQSVKEEMIDAGKSLGVFYFSSPNEDGTAQIEDPALSDMETFDSYYRRVKGKAPEGPAWEVIKFHGRVSNPVNWLVVAPPGTPAEHLQMLRESFIEATKDPEFLAQIDKAFSQELTITDGEGITRIVDEVSSVSDAFKDVMRGYISRMEH